MNRQTSWIQSRGGPLVCVEQTLAHFWLGTKANSVLYGADSRYANDYERACSVPDYVGVVPLGERYAVILGDMPLQTMIWHCDETLSYIVRVYYADPGVDVVATLKKAGNLDFSNPLETTTIKIVSAPLILFDSAVEGDDALDANLPIALCPGNYSIVTQTFQPDERTSVLVHKLQCEDFKDV